MTMLDDETGVPVSLLPEQRCMVAYNGDLMTVTALAEDVALVPNASYELSARHQPDESPSARIVVTSPARSVQGALQALLAVHEHAVARGLVPNA